MVLFGLGWFVIMFALPFPSPPAPLWWEDWGGRGGGRWGVGGGGVGGVVIGVVGGGFVCVVSCASLAVVVFAVGAVVVVWGLLGE